LTLSPLLQGVILQFEERVHFRKGPVSSNPYRDLWKLFHKQIVVPESASWIYWLAPFDCTTTTSGYDFRKGQGRGINCDCMIALGMAVAVAVGAAWI
jgi:hypothetical protein